MSCREDALVLLNPCGKSMRLTRLERLIVAPRRLPGTESRSWLSEAILLGHGRHVGNRCAIARRYVAKSKPATSGRYVENDLRSKRRIDDRETRLY